jgi:type IV pilus assembly protein PilO
MAIAEKLQGWRDAASEIELDQIDWEEPGTWPALVKSEELALRAEFQAKAFEAANLAALRDQMAEMNQMFGALVSQLPSDTEVPGLLEDITAIGSSNGLEFNSIELQEEILQEFYIELPIDILVTGTYHDLGSFVSGISGLPRIVTLHDFEMLPVESRPGVMQMSIVAKTYRYKEEG